MVIDRFPCCGLVRVVVRATSFGLLPVWAISGANANDKDYHLQDRRDGFSKNSDRKGDSASLTMVMMGNSYDGFFNNRLIYLN